MKLYTPCLLLLCLIYLQSCTIEKRRYTSGFHVERFHLDHNRLIDFAEENAVETSKKTSEIEIKQDEVTQKTESTESSDFDFKEPGKTEPTITASMHEERIVIQKKSAKSYVNKVQESHSYCDKSDPLPEKEKPSRNQTIGVISAILGIGGWVLLFIGIGAILAGVTLEPVLAMFVLSPFFELLSLVLAIATLSSNKNGNLDKGRTAAVIGLAASGLYLLFFLIGLAT